jgi:hypothetical protein
MMVCPLVSDVLCRQAHEASGAGIKFWQRARLSAAARSHSSIDFNRH